jgi:DNA-binding NtrC family response regulator
MPASVVIVHNHPVFLERVTLALRESGHEAAVFTDPMIALAALEAAENIDVLITQVEFPKGKPSGVSLALMTRRRDLLVVFIGQADQERYTDGIGELMTIPVDLVKLVETVTRFVDKSRRG